MIKHKLVLSVFIFQLLLLQLLGSGCSTPVKKFESNHQAVDEALDFLLGNLKTNLLASNAFVLYSAQGLLTSQDINVIHLTPQLQKNFKEVVGQFMGGPQIYTNIRNFYRRKLGDQKILAIYKLFQTQTVAEIFEKEEGELNPDNFQKFLVKWSKDSEQITKANIIDSLDDLSQISQGNILVVREIGSTLNQIKSLLSKQNKLAFQKDSEPVLGEVPAGSEGLSDISSEESREGLAMFEMQTRYLTSEVLRYTYQNLSLQELEHLSRILGNPQTQEFYRLIPESIHQAYELAFKDLKGEFAKYAHKVD